MQKILLVSVPMILLAIAVYITHHIDTGGKPATSVQFNPFEDNGAGSSPIVVGDGSVNVRQAQNLIHEIDGQHAYVSLADHKAAQVLDGGCDDPVRPEHDTPWGKCKATGTSSTLTAPWTIQLMDNGNNVVGTISTPDPNFPGLIMFSAGKSPSGDPYSIVGREPDNGKPGDGEGFVECAAGASKCSINLAKAVITQGGSSANFPLCANLNPGAGQKHCILKIAYCDSTITPGNCQ